MTDANGHSPSIKYKNRQQHPLRLCSLALATSLIFGCSQTPHKPLSTPTPEPTESAVQQSDLHEQPDEDHYRPFEKSTLFDLLSAEMAAKNSRPDITLGHYLKQAHYTKDPAVVARAMRIARYMKAHQATLDAARLWLSIEPDSEEALQAATIELIRIGRFEEAMEHIDTLLSQSATINFDFLVNGSRSLTEARRQEVLNHLVDLLKKYPNHPQLWFTRALLEEQSGDTEAALKNIDHTIFIKKDYLSAIIFKSKLLISLNKEQEALQLLEEALDDFPDSKRMRVIYARTLIEQDQLKEAQKQFEVLVNDHPEDNDLLLSLALIAWENGLDDQATTYLETLIAKGENADEAHTYLGQMATKRKEPALAIQHYRQVSKGSMFSNAQIQIARIQANTGELDAAVSTLQNARAQDPHHAIELFVTQSDIISNAGQHQQAYELLSSALSKHPNQKNLLYSRAMVAEKLGRIDQLEEDLRAIINTNPNSALALNALGYTLADKTDRLDEAHSLIQRAIALEPNDPAIIDSLGWLYFKKHNYKMALHYLQKAYDLFQDPEIASHLGEAYWASGKQEKALQIWRAALERTPENKIITQTMQRLGATEQ